MIHLCDVPEQTKLVYIEKNQNLGLEAENEWEEESGNMGGDGNVLYLARFWITQVYSFVNIY